MRQSIVDTEVLEPGDDHLGKSRAANKKEKGTEV